MGSSRSQPGVSAVQLPASPEMQSPLDTSGVVSIPHSKDGLGEGNPLWGAYTWDRLTPFQQGYVEAALLAAALRIPAKRRTFKRANHQQVYNHYLTTQPEPARTAAQGAAGNGYAIGRANASDREFAVRDSLAFAGWAAGVDLAKGEPAGFRHLAPETLAAMLRDCELACEGGTRTTEKDSQAGSELWGARQTGRLTASNRFYAFPPVTLSLGNGGLIYQAVAS